MQMFLQSYIDGLWYACHEWVRSHKLTQKGYVLKSVTDYKGDRMHSIFYIQGTGEMLFFGNGWSSYETN